MTTAWITMLTQACLNLHAYSKGLCETIYRVHGDQCKICPYISMEGIAEYHEG